MGVSLVQNVLNNWILMAALSMTQCKNNPAVLTTWCQEAGGKARHRPAS
jgi:hypothetical protein